MFIALSLLALAGAADSVATAAQADASAYTVVAEIALERGDCKSASEIYAAATATGTARLAARASEIAMACEHLPAAWKSAKRWRELAPDDFDAASVYAAIALKLYRLDEARSALVMILAGPDLDMRLAQLTPLLLGEADTSAVFAALSSVVNEQTASPATLTLLGELALAAANSHRAAEYAELALKANPKLFTARSLLAQTYVEQGDASKALESARAARDSDPKQGQFEVAEVLVMLDKITDARQELERLRSKGADGEEINRRLALIAFQTGDFKDARAKFESLHATGDAADAIQLYLADIAALQGDADAALAGYRKLVNSSLAAGARPRAAGILLDRGKRGEALTMLDDYVKDHPDRTFELTLTKVQLLADHGEIDSGLALLGAAAERHPHHPTLEYQQAVLLERDGKVRESVAQLERLLAERQQDPTLMNALGYTLAAHDMRLRQAEGLIKRALAIAPDSPAIVDSMGWVRFKRGDEREAASILERAYRLGRDSEIAAHWGEALWKIGKKDEANKVWSEALARDPRSKALKAVIDRHAAPEKK